MSLLRAEPGHRRRAGSASAPRGLHVRRHDKREGWIASLDTIAALNPKIVVAGHKDPEARDDDPEAILTATKTYIRDFDKAVNESRTPEELIDTMMRLHGERGNPYTLWAAAAGVSQQLGVA